jgi:hypothetical protein
MVNKGMLPLSRDLIYKFSIFLTDKLGIHFPLEKWRELEKKLIILASDLKFNDVDGFCSFLLPKKRSIYWHTILQSEKPIFFAIKTLLKH